MGRFETVSEAMANIGEGCSFLFLSMLIYYQSEVNAWVFELSFLKMLIYYFSFLGLVCIVDAGGPHIHQQI